MSMNNYDNRNDNGGNDHGHHHNDNRSLPYVVVTSTMWLLIVIVYLLVSFLFTAWTYTWIIFIVGAVIQNILNVALNKNS